MFYIQICFNQQLVRSYFNQPNDFLRVYDVTVMIMRKLVHPEQSENSSVTQNVMDIACMALLIECHFTGVK